MLARESEWHRVVPDVFDGPADILGGIEEDFPSGTTPSRMVGGTCAGGDERFSGRLLKVVDHFFGNVSVFANQDMDVIGHDRARVTRVTIAADRILESGSDRRELPRG